MPEEPSPHFSPVAAMMRALAGAIEDFGSVCVLATGSLQPGSARGLPFACKSIAGTTFEVACAHTGPKNRCEGAAQARHSRGQRSLWSLKPMSCLRNPRICKEFRHGIKRLVRNAG